MERVSSRPHAMPEYRRNTTRQNARVLHRRARSRPCARPRGYSGISREAMTMIYHPTDPAGGRERCRKEHADTAVYLAGGTDDLRLGRQPPRARISSTSPASTSTTITEKDGKVYIGALCTLQARDRERACPGIYQGGRRLLRLLRQAQQRDGRRQPRPAPLRTATWPPR